MNITKKLTKTIAIAMLGTALTTGVTTTYMPSYVEAYAGITSEDERQIGWSTLQQAHSENEYEADKMLTEMARDIVKNSKGELNFNDGQHKRWLNDEIYLLKTNEAANAHTYPGGFIMFNQNLLDFTRYRANDGSTWDRSLEKEYKINDNVFTTFDMNYGGVYPRGMVYAVLGHEIGHYANEDYNRIVGSKTMTSYIAEIAGVFMPQTQEGVLLQDSLRNLARITAKNGFSKADEQGADKKTFEYLKESEFYGVGDAMMFFYRLGNQQRLNNRDPWADAKSHPAPWKRLMAAADKIKEMSGGRLEFRQMTEAQYREDAKMRETGDRDIETVYHNKMVSYFDSETGKETIPYKRDFVLYVDGKILDWKRISGLGRPILVSGENNKQGLFPPSQWVTSQDRTFHIAGQIASAIELGIFKLDNLKYISCRDLEKSHGRVYKDENEDCPEKYKVDGGWGWIYCEGIGKDGKMHRKYIDFTDANEEDFERGMNENGSNFIGQADYKTEHSVIGYIRCMAQDEHYNDAERSTNKGYQPYALVSKKKNKK